MPNDSREPSQRMNTLNQMKVRDVRETQDRVRVVTTGAEYVFDRSGEEGRIDCYQRIERRRLLASIRLGCSLSTVSVEHKDPSTCVLHQQLGQGLSDHYLRVRIGGDSVLDLCSTRGLEVDVAGQFRPEYSATKDGNVLLADGSGGFGLYPCRGLRSVEASELGRREWRVQASLGPLCRLLLSVFPPRTYNLAQSFEERVVHHGSIGPWAVPPFPSDEMLEGARRWANVLVLHEGIWQGKLTRAGKRVETLEDIYAEAAGCCHEYVPVDEAELFRVVGKAHSLGMKVIPYMSPFYSTAKGAQFLGRVEEVLHKYGMDGVYYDGVSADVLDSYQMIQDTRRLLGDRILYVHCSFDPLMSRNVYCPAIDTYADYILRAENATRLNPRYLRWAVSGRHISNAIGYVCYYDLSTQDIRALVDEALAVDARFYLGSPETEREQVLKEVYFPKLDALAEAAGMQHATWAGLE